ncbi:MAG: hypothetical protein PUB94_02120 [Oscillospiraceae bacterium]|nr:hypothetical protein [Oscillospiraceae bacterium]
MKKLPEKFVERMKALLSDEYPLYEEAVNLQPVRGYRVNTNKISVSDFERLGALKGEKIPYCETGFYLNEDKIGSHPFFHAGMIYVQEPAAMMPAECVDIKPEWNVLDVCASPGGKSSQIRNKLSENSVLVSNEIVPSRCRILTGNIERMGFRNTVTTCADPQRLAAVFPKTFDLVVADAPCSGEGMFRKDDGAVAEWSEENVINCSKRQKSILENAAKCVKNGGKLLYSTCTFSLEENEMVVDDFLSRHPEFELVRVRRAVEENTCDGVEFDGCRTENIRFARRFYPHCGKGEGQFAAVMKNRLAPAGDFPPEKKNSASPDRSVLEFLDSVLTDFDSSHVLTNGDIPIYFTPDFSVPDRLAFSCGVTIGEKRRGYIQPHHQFFMAMGNKFKRKIDLAPDSDELRKFLHGESFNCDCENGWAAVTVCGCTVGGVKVVGSQAKNHYPKGLRQA